MSEEIIKVLNYICEQLGIAINWTSENVWPQVLDIFARYRILRLTSCSIWIVASVCIAIVFAALWAKVIKSYGLCTKEQTSNFWWHWRSCGPDMEGAFGLLMITIFGGIFVLACFVCNLSALLQWAFVPEVQILELLKGYIS